MYIQQLQIENFKSFEKVTINFNSDLNIFTGLNSSGKTTVLEAIALWQECFSVLLRPIGKANKKKLNRGEYVLGEDGRNYISFEAINSVRCPHYEDIFTDRDISKNIRLAATVTTNENDNTTTIVIPFLIKGDKNATSYNILLENADKYNYRTFNDFFVGYFPLPIATFYASPVAIIKQSEYFITNPRIKDAVIRRDSASVLRNRLYQLKNTSNYSLFLAAINEVLYRNNNNNVEQLEFYFDTDINTDSRVSVSFTTKPTSIHKDIALLGSGALQIIEILLNLFAPNPAGQNASALNIILLDEPDSHIHRDIQKRLLQVLARAINQQQIFLTTHNEAMIRAASPQHLFHIESVATKDYQPLALDSLSNKLQLNKQQGKSFSGAYPLATDAIMRAMGAASGLDFMNALEADKIIFVEGESDAQAIYTLLQRAVIPAPTAKYVFWVLNGIANLKHLPAYKLLFEQIRNQKTLWEKSILVIDRDFIMDKYYLPDSSKSGHTTIAKAISESLVLPVFMPSAYTFEATLFTNMAATTRLLQYWLRAQNINVTDSLGDRLISEYEKIKASLAAKNKDDKSITEAVKQHINLSDSAFFTKPQKLLFDKDQTHLTLAVQKYVEKCLEDGDFYKLMKKGDVEEVINATFKAEGLDIVFDIARDFIALLSLVDINSWISEWDFIANIARNKV